jgi:hypothetical protein
MLPPVLQLSVSGNCGGEPISPLVEPRVRMPARLSQPRYLKVQSLSFSAVAGSVLALKLGVMPEAVPLPPPSPTDRGGVFPEPGTSRLLLKGRLEMAVTFALQTESIDGGTTIHPPDQVRLSNCGFP